MINHSEIKKKKLILYFKIFVYLAATGLSCDRQDLLLQRTDSLVAVCGLSTQLVGFNSPTRDQGAFQVAQWIKDLPVMQEMWKTWVQSLGWEDPLEEEMATQSSFLVWRIGWTKEPGGLQSTGSPRLRHDWSNLAHPGSNSHPLPCKADHQGSPKEGTCFSFLVTLHST